MDFSPEELARMFGLIRELEFQQVNRNDSILEQQCRVEDIDAARLQRVLATNVIGSFLCERSGEAHDHPAWPQGWRHRQFVVACVSTGRGEVGDYVDYPASEGAIDLWLLAAEASYTTGTCIDPAGGS